MNRTMSRDETHLQSWLAQAASLDRERLKVAVNKSMQRLTVWCRGSITDDERDCIVQTGLVWSSQFGRTWIVNVKDGGE